jgi:photosystem II stability/assembly factor-like uncharacterized protein
MNSRQYAHSGLAIRRRFRGVAAWSLALVAIACNTQPAAPNPALAVISRAEQGVTLTTVGQPTPLPAGVGMGLPSGATLTTSDSAAAAVDFGTGEAVYLQSRSSVTLLRIASTAQGTSVGIQLNRGRLLAIMPSGSLEVSTPLGQVVLDGSAAAIEFAPSATSPASDVFTMSCLSGGCSANTRVYSGSLGPRDRLSITNSGLAVDQSQFSEADVAALLNFSSGDQIVAATLTAWPTSTGAPYVPTSTVPATLASTALPSATLAPGRDTPTPEPAATDAYPRPTAAQWQDIDIPGVSNDFNQPANNYGYNTVAVNPVSPTIVYVGTNYQGLYRSADSGATWTKIDTGAGADLLNGGRIWALAIDPFNPTTLYAASGYGSGGPLKSTDGGVSWRHMLPPHNATAQRLGTNDVYSVAVDPYTPNHLLASFHHNWLPAVSDSGVIESSDGGQTWTTHNPPAGSGWNIENSVWFLNNSTSWLLGSNQAGFWRTTDSGASWAQVSANHITAGGINSLYRDSQRGALYAAHSSGIMKSTDNGASWTEFSAGLPNAGYETLSSDGANLYTAPSYPTGGDYDQAHGPWYTVSITGTTWVRYNNQQTCDSSNNVCDGPVMMARDPAGSAIYAANWLGGLWKLTAPR